MSKKQFDPWLSQRWTFMAVCEHGKKSHFRQWHTHRKRVKIKVEKTSWHLNNVEHQGRSGHDSLNGFQTYLHMHKSKWPKKPQWKPIAMVKGCVTEPFYTLLFSFYSPNSEIWDIGHRKMGSQRRALEEQLRFPSHLPWLSYWKKNHSGVIQ